MGIQGIRGPNLPIQDPTIRKTGAPGFADALQQANQPKSDCCLQRPVPGQAIRGFGPGHPGVDLAADLNSPVRSADHGTVESVGWVGGYGNLLVVRHQNNERAYYAHLQQSEVQPGEQVQAGQEIARSGNSGSAQQPHLHFELRQGGRPVDPLHRLG